jgi:hypothetical protein
MIDGTLLKAFEVCATAGASNPNHQLMNMNLAWMKEIPKAIWH